jgi:hypothetical protein
MTESKQKRSKYGEMQEISYYAQGLLDLEDVVNTVNKMIDRNVPAFDRSNVKKMCSATAIPLKNRYSGMILKIRVPSTVFLGEVKKES